MQSRQEPNHGYNAEAGDIVVASLCNRYMRPEGYCETKAGNMDTEETGEVMARTFEVMWLQMPPSTMSSDVSSNNTMYLPRTLGSVAHDQYRGNEARFSVCHPLLCAVHNLELCQSVLCFASPKEVGGFWLMLFQCTGNVAW